MNDYEKLLIKMKKQKHQLRILINKITDYKQEIEELKAEIKELNDSSVWWSNRFNAVERDNERLNNIINELESHLEQQWLEWKDDFNDEIVAMANEDKCILDKLKELKSGVNNV